MRNTSLPLVAVFMLISGMVLVAGQAPPAPSGLPPAASRMYAIVKNVRPGELRWQEIPWLVDLQDGLRLAKEEKRPLLLWVSGDDPLEKC
jgi:hypothetical protein